MKRIIKHSAAALAVAAAIAAPAAYATNGYFMMGYGAKARGMGGAGVAFPQDAVAAATNPAGMSWVGNRSDFGLELFSPRRYGEFDSTGIGPALSAQRSPPFPAGLGGADVKVTSDSNYFVVPNGGYVTQMGNMALGVSVVGAGGMNTRYNSNIYDRAFFSGTGSAGQIPNTSTLGVNLAQMLILPTVSFKVDQNNSIGASLIVGYQQFRAYGLGDFAAFGFSSDATNLTNRGNDSAWGWGLRVGWLGKINNRLSLGATAATKTYMQKFSKYKGLFAQQGEFDIPANFAVGLAFKADPKTTVAFDIERILYSGVKAIANTGPTPSEFFSAFAAGGIAGNYPARLLGKDGGFGFGWQDQTVYKLGVNYAYNSQWTFRGGLNYGKSPIPQDQNFFNILAPGVVETHLTFGFTYSPSHNNELTVAYMHAFQKDQSHRYPAAGGMYYDTKIGMHQDSLDVSYAWKF
ncbi:MAG: outer membrane protein transport protein [Gammaproteobacteria bacterium]